ncbi:MAG: glycine betaine ABC transporter substrate-binding protein [Actinomycetota bacterium]
MALLVVLVTLGFAACSGGNGDGTGDVARESGAAPGADTETVTAAEARTARPEARESVTFGVTGWTGARITAALAELLVERRLGYPVSIVAINDDREMLDDLLSGELDAVLEVWPTDLLPETRERMDAGAVEDLGRLGVVAATGWFVPRYVVAEDPRLASWEAYQRPETGRLFATDQTGGRGRFLGTDPSWLQYDEQIIEALSLPFDVVYSGSEAATVAELEERTASTEPVLLYWWSPSSEVTRFDLVPVQLPPRDAACESAAAAGEPAPCAYPEEPVTKLGATDLADRLPDLHRFLSRFTVSTADQQALIDQVDNDSLSIRTAVERWADDNRAVWEPWLEP